MQSKLVYNNLEILYSIILNKLHVSLLQIMKVFKDFYIMKGFPDFPFFIYDDGNIYIQ